MADTEAGEESLDVQCDNSSSSSSENLISEIENLTLDIPDKSGSLTEQISENTRELQINQPQEPVAQQSVQISGGEFVGAHFGPTNYHLTKHELQVVHHHHHHHHQESKKSIPAEESECIKLSETIQMWFKKNINKTGNVFIGEQISKITGTRKLAIKSLRYNEENKREAQMLTKLNPHEHVVSIVESNDYRQGPVPYIYIAMELCHTQNLYDHVIENKNNNVPFDPQLSISQANQLLDGISYIHENNIIHRDFKPHNVLLSLDKKTLKIADFGLSKPMTSGRSVTALTNQSVGTDGYRAPETYNSKVISKQADIYSLGLVFYFLWSYGCHCFGDDPDMWNANIKKDRDRDLSKLLLEDKDAAKDLLQWALKFNPKDRPTADMILKHVCFGGMATAPRQRNLSGTKLTHQDDSNVARSQVEKDKVKFNAMIKIKKQAEGCFDTDDYSGASGRLKKLLEYQDNANKRYKILRQMAECQLLLEKPIEDITAEIISTARNLHMAAVDVVADADKYLRESKFLPSFILYVCANTMIFTVGSEMRYITEVGCCFTRVYTLIMKALKSSNLLGKLLRTQGIPCVCKMLEQFRNSKSYTVLLEANFINIIAAAFLQIGDFNTVVRITSESIDHMEDSFGSNVCKHYFYGVSLMNAGSAYLQLGKVAKATDFFEQASTALKEAEDFENLLQRTQLFQQLNLRQYSLEAKRQSTHTELPVTFQVNIDPSAHQQGINIDLSLFLGQGTVLVGNPIPLKKLENESDDLSSLRESADLYHKNHEYSMALTTLNEIFRLLTEPTQKIETLQQIAECKVMCQQKCDSEIDGIILLCQSLKFPAVNVLATATKCMANSHFLRACIMYVCAAKMCKTGCKPDEALSVLGNSSNSVRECFKRMISNTNMRGIATKPIPQFINVVHDELCNLRGVAESLKIMAILDSFNNIAHVNIETGLYQDAIVACNNGIRLAVQQSSTNELVAMRHASLLNNIGTAYFRLEMYEDASNYFHESINKGNNIPGTNVVMNQIRIAANNNLRNCRSALKKQKQQLAYAEQQNTGNLIDGEPSALPGRTSSPMDSPAHSRLRQTSLSATFTDDNVQDAHQSSALPVEPFSSSMESPAHSRLRQTSLSATSTDDGEDASAIDPKTAAVRPKQKSKKKKKKR